MPKYTGGLFKFKFNRAIVERIYFLETNKSWIVESTVDWAIRYNSKIVRGATAISTPLVLWLIYSAFIRTASYICQRFIHILQLKVTGYFPPNSTITEHFVGHSTIFLGHLFLKRRNDYQNDKAWLFLGVCAEISFGAVQRLVIILNGDTWSNVGSAAPSSCATSHYRNRDYCRAFSGTRSQEN